MIRRYQRSFLACMLMVAAATVAMAWNDLKVEPSVRNIPERGAVRAALLSSGAWSASLIVPTGWKIGGSNDKMILQSQDFGAQIEVRLRAGATAEELRSQILSRTDRSLVLNEYTSAVSAGKTLVVEAEHAPHDSLRLRTCSVLVTQEKSVVEFTLIADSQSYAKYRRTLENLVASLRMN
jgi:hypothetical protein